MLKMWSMVTLVGVFGTVIADVNLSEVDVNAAKRGYLNESNDDKQAVRFQGGGGGVFFEDFQTQADPMNPVLPVDWQLYNVDGLTPNAAVNYVTDAWVVRDDFINPIDPTNFSIFSTSWYDPFGQADDWIVTPLISLPTSSMLSWRAYSPDASFRDGYEVYVSTTTPDVAGCTAGGTVFSIAEEETSPTARQVSLSDAGFSDEDVYICFRNNSNDKFLLIVDDIGVAEILANDVRIDAVAAVPEYTTIPDKIGGIDIPLGIDFTNVGLSAQSNISVGVTVMQDSIPVNTVNQVFTGPLDSGMSQSLDLGSVNVNELGAYDLQYTISLDGVSDDNLADNETMILDVVIVNVDTMSRDDGVSEGALGIGGVTTGVGYLGQMFAFDQPVTVSGTNFVHNNNECDTGGTEECGLDGETLRVDVFVINADTGLPGAMVGSSEGHVVPAGNAEGTSVDVAFVPTLNLMPGQYVFAVTEPVRTMATFGSGNIGLNSSDDRFTDGTVWINWDNSPFGDWANAEAFGDQFRVSYLIRPQFIETDLIFRNGLE